MASISSDCLRSVKGAAVPANVRVYSICNHPRSGLISNTSVVFLGVISVEDVPTVISTVTGIYLRRSIWVIDHFELMPSGFLSG